MIPKYDEINIENEYRDNNQKETHNNKTSTDTPYNNSFVKCQITIQHPVYTFHLLTCIYSLRDMHSAPLNTNTSCCPHTIFFLNRKRSSPQIFHFASSIF